MNAPRADGLGWPRVLLVARGPVDIDGLRRRRLDHLVIVHARRDGTFDERVQPSFARAIVTGNTADARYVRAAADYASARLDPGGRIEVADPMRTAAAALQDVATALPHMKVSLAELPAPGRGLVVEADPEGDGRPRSRLRRLIRRT